MVLFIFPVAFIVMVGPVAIKLSEASARRRGSTVGGLDVVGGESCSERGVPRAKSHSLSVLLVRHGPHRLPQWRRGPGRRPEAAVHTLDHRDHGRRVHLERGCDPAHACTRTTSSWRRADLNNLGEAGREGARGPRAQVPPARSTSTGPARTTRCTRRGSRPSRGCSPSTAVPTGTIKIADKMPGGEGVPAERAVLILKRSYDNTPLNGGVDHRAEQQQQQQQQQRDGLFLVQQRGDQAMRTTPKNMVLLGLGAWPGSLWPGLPHAGQQGRRQSVRDRQRPAANGRDPLREFAAARGPWARRRGVLGAPADQTATIRPLLRRTAGWRSTRCATTT